MAAIFLGAEDFSLANHFEAAVNALPGDPAGFAVSILATQSQLLSGRRPVSQRGSGSLGWEFQLSASALFFALGGASNATTSPGVAISGDVGRVQLYTGVWDGVAGVARAYAKRAQVSTGSPLTGGYAPDTAVKPMIGRIPYGAGAPAVGFPFFGLFYAVGIPTLAQIQAHHDAVMAHETMKAIPGMSGTLIDLTQDIRGNGGVMPATLVDRGVGGVNFTKVGSPTIAAQYARAWGW